MPPRAEPPRDRAAVGVFTTSAQPWDGRNLDPESWGILLDNDISISDVPAEKQVPFVGHTLSGPALQFFGHLLRKARADQQELGLADVKRALIAHFRRPAEVLQLRLAIRQLYAKVPGSLASGP